MVSGYVYDCGRVMCMQAQEHTPGLGASHPAGDAVNGTLLRPLAGVCAALGWSRECAMVCSVIGTAGDPCEGENDMMLPIGAPGCPLPTLQYAAITRRVFKCLIIESCAPFLQSTRLTG